MIGFDASDRVSPAKSRLEQGKTLLFSGQGLKTGSATASSGAGGGEATVLDDAMAGVVIPDTPVSILVVDDEKDLGYFLQESLATAGYVSDVANDGLQAMQMLEHGEYHLLVCDVCLPDIGGLEVLRRVKQAHPDSAVIMLTGCADVNVAVPALRAGASDYLVKPFHIEELLIAVERALDRRRLEIENRLYQQSLEDKVRERTRELVQKNHDLSNLISNTIGSLVSTLEAKDTYTEGHSWKVAVLAANLGRKLCLASEVIENLSLAGLLHDIGKIGVRDEILNKPSKLTDEEYRHIKQHPVIGERILSPLEPLRPLLPCVRHHHEWFNGKGYPDGLAGEAIPLAVRILTLADVYEAIRSKRAYRPARSREEAVAIVKELAGTQFDPELVEVFLEMDVD
jgi:putative two-component system response regulator